MAPSSPTRLLVRDELIGFARSKVMIVLWVVLPLIALAGYLLLPRAVTEARGLGGLSAAAFVGFLMSSIAGTVAALMVAVDIVSERNRKVYELFVIRPIRREAILLGEVPRGVRVRDGRVRGVARARDRGRRGARRPADERDGGRHRQVAAVAGRRDRAVGGGRRDVRRAVADDPGRGDPGAVRRAEPRDRADAADLPRPGAGPVLAGDGDLRHAHRAAGVRRRGRVSTRRALEDHRGAGTTRP